MRKIGLLGATALRSAAIFAAVAGVSSPAFANTAQDQAQPTESADAEEDSRETITVTGSRIRRPEFTGVLPGVQVDQEQIATRGFTNALDIINDVPLTGTGASLSGTNGLGQPTALGLGFADLLDLGTARTLTLVNGRRFVSGNTATLFAFANETGGQVDINSIPTLLVERVDVVTVGGAAAYGTDAIAGVVNYILRDDFDGTDLSAIVNITQRGDGFGYNLRALHGMNFAGDRGNVVLNFEYSHVDEIFGAFGGGGARDEIANQAFFVANPRNGGIRNPAFAPSIAGGSNPFLPVGSDGATGNLGENFTRSLLVSFGGNIFQSGASAFSGVVRPTAATFTSAATQAIPGVTVSSALAGCGIANPRFCDFAPSALPGTSNADPTRIAFAQAVLAALRPGDVASGTDDPATAANEAQIQRNNLALSLLQAGRQTPREFFAANPNVPLNAFLGRFVAGFIDVANTDTTPITINGTTVASNVIFPRIAVPLRFNAAGDVIPFSSGTITPDEAGTVGNINAPDGFYDPVAGLGATPSLLRPRQDRYLANLIGSFDITPGIEFFTENLYARVKAFIPRVGATQNTVGTTSAETAPLVINVNNPFLSDADRTALASYGITNAFLLSRVNQDILGDNPSANETETIRTVMGFRGDFDFIGQNHNWEVSGTWGRADLTQTAASLLDVEFALATDVVDEGLFLTGVRNGVARCRAQLDPALAATYGTVGGLPGVQPNVIRVTGADGLPTEVVFAPTASAAQIAACQPLNPFGQNNMSQAAKDYVRAPQRTDNRNEQLYFQALLSGGLFDLPGGGLQYALSGEYRNEDLSIIQDINQQTGRTRNAPTSPTEGTLTTLEFGAELQIPIFGPDFNIPLFHSLEFNPAVRFTRQRGSSVSFRNLAGDRVDPEYEGDWETIFSLAGTWRPIRDIAIRGNYTKSLRQPNIVELFLTNQSAFAATLDPCSNQRIDVAANPAVRRAACRQLAINNGNATDAASADAFLQGYVSNDTNQTVAFAGNSGLSPERGESYTFGAIVTPRFIPRLSISADYINLLLEDQIIPTNPTQAAGFCVDSPTLLDTTAQFGTNLCDFIPRRADFQVDIGAAGQYLNLSATKIEGINISLAYSFGLPSEWGRITLRSNVFHLMRYDQSATGNFDDTQLSAGAFARPEWESVSSIRWEQNELYAQLTHRFQSSTTLFTGGQPATVEFAEFFRYPEQHIFDLSIGAELESGFRVQFLVANITDETYAGSTGYYNGVYFDTLGRRFQVAAGIRF